MKQIIVKGDNIEFVKGFDTIEEAQDYINNHKELNLKVDDIYESGYNNPAEEC